MIGLENEGNDALLHLRKRDPVMFYGANGNGKTLLAIKVANTLAKEMKKSVIYLQLYPEMTKNSLIGGETIQKGSIVIQEQSILKFGKEGKGAIFIIDECTHTTEPVLLAFNSLIEEPYQTVVGDEIYKMDKSTRFIFCGNYPDHIGNIHLPTSFQNRLFIIPISLPNQETLIEIGKEASDKVPVELLGFVANIIATTSEVSFPISARNMAMAAKSIPSLFEHPNPSYKKLPESIRVVCEKLKIDEENLKRLLQRSLMANAKFAGSTGPDRVSALLW